MMRLLRNRSTFVVGATLLAFTGMAALAQTVQEDPRGGGGSLPAPPLAEGVQRAIDAPYFDADEKQERRVFHGVWAPRDLSSPALRAKAALDAGVWDDRAFAHDEVPVEDRADAMLQRGELEEAIELLAGASSIRAQRIRAAALEQLGRFEEADAAIDPIANALLRNQTTEAEDLVEGVRAFMIRARLRGEPASNYQEMMSLLARARDELDRLYWPAYLVEAELLYDKDNSREARAAVMQALSMNPRSAAAWELLGQIAVDGFNMDGASQIAAKLDELASDFPNAPELGSPLGAIVTARARLRQNDPDGAAEALDDTLGRFPTYRAGLAMRAAAQAVRYDFAGADERLAQFAALSPGSPLALYEVGRALSEARQYEQSARYLEEASALQPNWPPPLVERGLLELQAGRDQEALEALTRVAELDPFQVRARNSLALIQELLTYETVESDHFIVRFRPGVDRVMAEEMLAPLEEIHSIVAGALDHEPSRKTTIELMPDHRWFGVRITGMPAIHTIAAATGPVIAMEAPKIGPNHTGEYDWVRVIRHEYVHTVTLSRTKNRIPHWFTEAAAVYLEGAPRDYSTCQLLVSALTTDQLFDMDEINIAFVRPKKPTDRAQAYAQGHWMYEYIVERFGEEAPLKLMDLYADGVREREAMPSVLGIERDEFIRDFTAWAWEDAATWGMATRPSLDALLLEETLRDDAMRTALRESLEGFSVEASMLAGGAGLERRTYSPPLIAPTEPLVDEWLMRHGEHPDLLELSVGFALRETDGEPTLAMTDLLERYANARPVDPAPHRLLAKVYLGAEDPDLRDRAAPHLEYLDVREQTSPTFASALARLYLEERAIELASTKAERATQIAPFDASLRELAARAALLDRDLLRAQRHLAALVELEPDRSIHADRLERVNAMIQEQGG